MNFHRYHCSHLVALRNNSAESVVNLEEIWESGAVLESEDPVAEGSKVEIRCEKAFFAGSIVQAEQHEFGWRLQVAFSPMTPWTPDRFLPEHLTDLSGLDQG